MYKFVYDDHKVSSVVHHLFNLPELDTEEEDSRIYLSIRVTFVFILFGLFSTIGLRATTLKQEILFISTSISLAG